MKYKIAYQPDVSQVYLSGNVNEHIGPVLVEIREQLRGERVVFDLTFLNQINSIGVATWLAHIGAFDDLTLTYEHAPTTFSSLWTMIPGFGGRGVVESLYVDYACQFCETDEQHRTLVRRADCVRLGDFPEQACPTCQAGMMPEPSDAEFLSIFLPES